MCRVLVVDDEPHVRDLASRALGEVNLECDTAGDGREAIQRFDASPYEVVATDLKMPRRHGHALAVDLLNRPAPPKVVVMTGFAERRLVRDLMSRGVHDIFLKPFNYSALAMKLLSLVERKRLVEQAPATKPPESPTHKLTRIEKALLEITEIFADSLATVFDLDSEVSEPPHAVTEFIARFAKLEEEEGAAAHHRLVDDERREKERVACSRSAVVLPVNRRFVPEGEPFMAAIRDVSESGIRLLHTRATNAQYLALNWRAETLPYCDLRVVAEVARCQPMGPFYNIAGQFVLAD